MKKLKLLKVVFENYFEPEEITALRAAIAAKVKTDAVLFHHHLDENRRLHKYPLAQFKIIDNKAHILCMEDACEPMMEFLSSGNWDIEIRGNKVSLSILSLNLKQINIQVWDKTLNYRIYNWLALNTDNYKKYLTTESLAERIVFLERILTAHIIAFAEGIRFSVEKPLKVAIHHIYKERLEEYKGVKLMAFDLEFAANVTIPPYIGLGKAVSVGYGVVKRMKVENTIKQSKNVVSKVKLTGNGS